MKRIIYIVLIVALLPLNFGCSKHYEFELEKLTTNNNNSGGNNDDVSGTHKGHDYVDLGLSVKWATCNVGANSPEAYGDYYAWGETTTKNTYTESNCSTYGQNISDIKGTSRDVAHVKWGGNWRMPTEEEFYELLSKCTWSWATQNGTKGYKVTSKINGNSIFLPAAGYRSGDGLYDAGSDGSYWSSTPNSENTRGAYVINFYSGNRITGWCYRYFGLSVRPVLE